MKKILTMRLDKDRQEIISRICDSIGAECVKLGAGCLDRKLGELIDSGEADSGPEADTGMEMVIFAGLTDRELDIYIDRYKKTGAAVIPLKAVMTDTNREWTVRQLYRELGREYMYYKMRGR